MIKCVKTKEKKAAVEQIQFNLFSAITLKRITEIINERKRDSKLGLN